MIEQYDNCRDAATTARHGRRGRSCRRAPPRQNAYFIEPVKRVLATPCKYAHRQNEIGIRK